MKIVFTGGGTAGHIFPILAIIREIKKIHPPDPNLKFIYIGPKDKYGLKLLAKEGVEIKTIITGKIRRYFSIKNFFDLFKMPIGFFQSFFFLFVKAPDLMFSKGGFGSIFPSFAARILQIPVFLHESDVVPGLSSKIQSKWVKEIFTSFQETEYFPKKRIVCSGNPIRKEILNGNKFNEAEKIFNLQGDKPLIFIIGGSQGAKSINNTVLEILPELLTEFEIVLQTGKKNYAQTKAEANVVIRDKMKKYFHIIPFLNEAELKHILAACKLVVSRAGSGALFEIAATGKPSVLIPLPKSAQDHQAKNAYKFSENTQAVVMEQENLKPHFFLEKLKYLFSRENALYEMALGAQNFSKTKAANIIANYMLEYLAQTNEKSYGNNNTNTRT